MTLKHIVSYNYIASGKTVAKETSNYLCHTADVGNFEKESEKKPFYFISENYDISCVQTNYLSIRIHVYNGLTITKYTDTYQRDFFQLPFF
jgi:hypothetical protein